MAGSTASPGSGSVARAAALERIRAHLASGEFESDLRRRIAFRTESQVPESRPNLLRYLREEIAPALEVMGYTVRIHDNPAGVAAPFLIGRRIEDPALPTVLTYGHGDVIRGLDEQWAEGLSPWQLERRGDRWYGRGTADNKGQHSINLAALSCVIAARGRLGFNSIVLFETGEELGSPGLHAFAREQAAQLRADILIGSDGPRLSPNRPTIFMGTRGALNFDLIVECRQGAHHSGNWGGLLANPATILCNAIASIIDATGRVAVRDILPAAIPDSVRRALADVEVDPGADGPTIDRWWGEPGLTPAEKVFGWNTFEVLAIGSGNPQRPVNAVPARAQAHCQIRYTVDRDPAGFLDAIRRHLAQAGFDQVRVSEAARDLMNATRLDPDHPAVGWAVGSIERSLGTRPAILPNLGGSLPNEVFTDIIGVPTIWVPHSYASCGQHAPDEHALEPIIAEGLAAMTGLFWDAGEAGFAERIGLSRPPA
jgi:acetylornithine deacetylase/succinyl-diaminopimelate desuccinylase-like protein